MSRARRLLPASSGLNHDRAGRTRLPSGEQQLAFLRAAVRQDDSLRHIEVIETHFAWLFLNRRHVYKLRKALRHGHMDYRTPARRRRGCRAEIALNRRLAPGVYLGVVPLTVARAGQLRLGGGGRAVDYLVRMRRLPAGRMLDAVLLRRPLRSRELAGLLAVLGAFFRATRRRPMSGRSYLSRLRRGIAADRRALLALTSDCGTLIERVVARQRAALDGLRAELAARAARLVDGHGDLRPEHVCLEPPMPIIDCIEFDPELRRLDPLEEMAFLALEIARLGHTAQAWSMLRRYRAAYEPGASDALLHFYISRRALVRARLAAWHIGDPQFPDPRPWRLRTRSYLRDAARHAALIRAVASSPAAA